MGRKQNKKIIVLILCLLLLSSCNHAIIPSENKNSSIVPENITLMEPSRNAIYSELTEDERREVEALLNANKVELTDNKQVAVKHQIANKLYTEFIYYYLLNERGDSLWNSLLLEDKVIGLKTVYKNYISEEASEIINSFLDKYRNSEHVPHYISPVFFGYSESGLRVVIIMTNSKKGGYTYNNAIDYIRDDNFESNILRSIWALDKKYICDIYVEDLTSQKERSKIELQPYIVNGKEHIPVERTNKLPQKTKDFLDYYGRKIATDSTINYNMWNMFFFENDIDGFDLTVDGEAISIVNTVSDL